MVKSTKIARSRRPDKVPAAKSASASAAGKPRRNGREIPRSVPQGAARIEAGCKAAAKAASSPHAKSKAAAAPPKPKAALAPRSEQPKPGKWVYAFGDGKAEGKAKLRDLLGGKGANLAEMANLGLPVPPGFTITTEVCTYFYAQRQNLSAGARRPRSRRRSPKSAGSPGGGSATRDNPLLVSVRSGARASMPGMMDTVLNLGLNDMTVEALAQKSGDRALRL